MPLTQFAIQKGASRDKPYELSDGGGLQSRCGSSFIWGVWHDAKYVADRISTRRLYLDYPGAVQG